MKRPLLPLSAGLVALSLLPTVASAADIDCTFTDKVTSELRACEEGPSEESWGYLVEDEFGELELLPEYQEEFELIHPIEYGLVTDSGDPEYDEVSDGGVLRELFEALLFLLKLLAAAGESHEEYIQNAGLSGDYDGVLSTNGTTATAMMHLDHNGNQVEGGVWILSEGLVLEGGICPDYAISFGGLNVNATSSAYNSAAGQTTRSIDILGFSAMSVDVDFNMHLSTVDHETLWGDVVINAPFPCRDQIIHGEFTRRPLL